MDTNELLKIFGGSDPQMMELYKGILGGPSAEEKSNAVNMGLLHTGLGLLGRKNIGDAGILGVQAGQGYLDKGAADKQRAIQSAGSLMQMQKMMADTQQAQRKNAFFSPQGQAQFMTPGQSAIQPQADELGGGPGRQAVAPQLDFSKMLAAAAANNFVPPETYANHLAQRDETKAKLALAKQTQLDRIEQQRAELDAKNDRSMEANQMRRDLAEQAINARKDLAMLAASLRQPAQPPAPSIKDIVDPKDPSKMIAVDTRVYNEAAYLGGNKDGVLGVSGKEPSYAKREETQNTGKETLRSVIDNLKANYTDLAQKGGIPSSGAGTLSNAQSYIRSSGIGQLGGKMIGSKEQDLRNEIQSSRLQLLNAIKNATGMTSQQMNSNVELKTWLDAVTNPQNSVESNIGILNKLEERYVNGRGRRTTDAAPKDAKTLKFDANGNPVP